MKTFEEAVITVRDSYKKNDKCAEPTVITQYDDSRYKELLGEVGTNRFIKVLIEDYIYFMTHTREFTTREVLIGLFTYAVAIGMEMEKAE